MKSILVICAGLFVASLAIANETTPTQVCQKLVEAAKTNNTDMLKDTVLGFENAPMANDGKSTDKFHKMHNDYLAKIKDLTCGSETIADTHAFVQAESSGQKRLVPFVKVGGLWKFDTKTYKTFYKTDKKAQAK